MKSEVGQRGDRVFYRDWHKTYPVIDYGEGIYLYDKSGKRYIDGVGGVHVVSIGHGVKEVVDAMARQAARCAFAYGAQFTSEAQQALADKVIQMAPQGMARVYFVSGGSEANEVALKTARQYFVERGRTTKYRFIARWKSYHGSSIGAMSMTGHAVRRTDYVPFLLNFPHTEPAFCYRCSFGKTYPNCGLECAWDLERVIKMEGPDTIAAFIAEPIVGTTTGAVEPPDEYFPIIRQICDKYDILFVADEVITGCGRTGKNYGIQHWPVRPDIITVGKGLASGYNPLGAVIYSEKVYDVFAKSQVRSSFFIGYTYSGNPVSCAVGLAVQEYVEKHDLTAKSAETGAYLKGQMVKQLGKHPIVGDVRGRGMLLGIEFVKDKATKEPWSRQHRVAETINGLAFEKGLILMPGSGTVDGFAGDHLLVTPPFTTSKAEADTIVHLLEEAISEVEQKLGAAS